MSKHGERPSPRRTKAAKPTRRKPRPEVELLEARFMLSVSGYRPITEVGNNPVNANWGTAGTDLIRQSLTAYANGYSTPSLAQDLSPRAISDILNNQADPADPSQDVQTVDGNSLSDFGYAFGQFMDHDMDLTLDNGPQSGIPVPPGDPIGGPNDTPLYFAGSNNDPKTGTGPRNPAQQINSITSYLDLSQVYGSDTATALALRTLSGGQMKTSPGGLPPLDNTDYFTAQQLQQINASVGGMANGGPFQESQLFVTGDTRGNENLELTTLQTLFLDNHNRIAGELQQEHPGWSDEQLYQEARKINIAQYQSIVYNEWIPAVLGASALPGYRGYNPFVNASISNEFSTVAFRFGHSLLSGNIERAGNDGQEVAGAVSLAQDFFDPALLNGQGQPSATDPFTGLSSTDIGAVLKGESDGNSQATDVLAINEVRNLLFNEVVPNIGFGQDLIALDIERARVNGIGSYNQLRVAYGLPAVTSFSQITSNLQVQQELKAAYGNVNNIDAFEGGLAEDHVRGSDVGPLFQQIMVNQFTRLRDGDRFFYLNETWNADELNLFAQGNTLTKVIEANTDITNLSSNVFLFRASIGGTVSLGGAAGSAPGNLGLPGVVVQLQDTSGDVLATTVTDLGGHYSFNQHSGPSSEAAISPGVSATGYYQIVLVLPPSLQQTSPNPAPVLISRGGLEVTGVNFVVQFQGPAASTATAAPGGVSNPVAGAGVELSRILVGQPPAAENGGAVTPANTVTVQLPTSAGRELAVGATTAGTDVRVSTAAPAGAVSTAGAGAAPLFDDLAGAESLQTVL